MSTDPNEIKGLPQAKWINLGNLLKSNRALLEPLLRRDFLYVLDHLRCLPSSSIKTDPLIQWWEELAGDIGITEDQLLAEKRKELKETMGDLVGCSWLKCFMFERDSDSVVMYHCAGCHKAAYCGVLCQERLAQPWSSQNHTLLTHFLPVLQRLEGRRP